MTCRKCKKTISVDARYCDACGASVETHSSTSNTVRDSDIGGPLLQAGRDIHYGKDPDVPAAEYEVKWSWRSPLTQAALGWISLVIGLGSLWAGYEAASPAISGIVALSNGQSEPADSPRLVWIFAFLVGVVLFSVCVSLARVAKNRTQHVGPSILPALTGWDGRIGFARFSGSCPTCKGKLRFYNKPVQWLLTPTGGRGKVTERRMVVECRRNPNHEWSLDQAEREG